MSWLYHSDTPYGRKVLESLEKSKDSDAATLLVMLMRDISEHYWCAGWLNGLEFILWRIINGDESEVEEYFENLQQHFVNELKRLHEKSGGWWMWQGHGLDSGEVFVTTEEWFNYLKSKEML